MNSTERRKKGRATLGSIADSIIDEIWNGKWAQVPGRHTTAIGAWLEILREFETRCPGYTRGEYEEALHRSAIFRQ